jgi:hypothetical protein
MIYERSIKGSCFCNNGLADWNVYFSYQVVAADNDGTF